MQSTPFTAAGITRSGSANFPRISLFRHIESLVHINSYTERCWYSDCNQAVDPALLVIDFPKYVWDWPEVVSDTLRRLAPDGYPAMYLDSLEDFALDTLDEFMAHSAFAGVQVLAVTSIHPVTQALPLHLPSLCVLDIRTPVLYDLYWGNPYIPGNWNDIAQGIKTKRRDQRSNLRALYLHIADEVDLVRKGQYRQTSCMARNEADVLHAVDEIESVPEVRLIGKDETVDYASYIE